MSRRIILWSGTVMMFLLLVSCVMSEEQIEKIATTAGEATAAAITVTAPALGLDSGAAAGVAGAVGLGVAALLKWLLPKLTKKE